MNWLDLGLGVILLLGLIRGVTRGFLREIFGLVGVAAGLSLALIFATPAAKLMAQWLPRPAAYPLAFVLLFFGSIGASALIGRFMTRLADQTPLGIVNRVLGGGMGLVKALVAVLVFLSVLHAVPGGAGVLRGSMLAPWAEASGALLKNQARKINLPRVGGRGGSASTPKPASRDSL